MTDAQYVRECLAGPVPAIRTAFDKDGNVDFAGVRDQVDVVIEAGCKAILISPEESHYLVLSDQEVLELMRAVVAHTNQRALVIAGDRHFSTGQACAFARQCRNAGVDVLLVTAPDWAKSCTPVSLVAHYMTVSRGLLAMVSTAPFGQREPDFGYETLDMVLDEVPHVVAVKEDIGGAFARRVSIMVYEQWAVVCGGRMEDHLSHHPFGCDGYLSTFISFAPDIARQYWSAIERADLVAAGKVARDVEIPFFEFLAELPGGFDAGMHGVLELFGVCRRWRRPPYYSLSDADMEKLADGLMESGLF